MDIGMGDIYSQYADIHNNGVSESLTKALDIKPKEADKEEMLDACKEFEQYFVEQMINIQTHDHV